MTRSAALSALVALAFLLAACGSLPRPFQPADKSAPEAVEADFGARAGVFVEPIPGLPQAQSERLTEALVQALRGHDVAAGRRASNRASYRISARPGDADKMQWSLAEPGGAVVFSFDDRGDADRVQLVARRVAEVLTPVASVPAGAALVLALQPVDGAPGDGRQSLTRAMRRALAQYGLAAAETLEGASYIVLGSVHVERAPDSTAHQSITVEWTILAPDGARVGSVNQSNVVPTGALDSAWGAVARAVAENGAQGIVAMLDRVGALE